MSAGSGSTSAPPDPAPSVRAGRVDRNAPRWVRRLPLLAGGFSVALGVAVLIGWALDDQTLKSVLPNQVAMKANTAAGFIAVGVALVVLAPAEAGRRRRLMGQVIAAVVTLLGLGSLAEYVLGRDLGIDQVLFREQPGAIFTRFPGQMSPATAAVFFALGIALLLVNVRARWLRRLLDLTLAALAVFCLAAITAYVYRSRFLYLTGGAEFTPMAFPTAIGMLVATTGARAARPDAGQFARLTSAGWEGSVARRLAPAIVVAALSLGFLVEWSERRGLLAHGQETAVVVVAVIVAALVALDHTVRGVARSQVALRRVEEEIELFFRLSRDMLCVANFDGYFVRLNPAWETALGWRVEELTSRPFIEFVHPDDREATIAEAARVAAGAETSTFEDRFLCKDGSYRWLTWNAVSVPERGLLIAAARDITEGKRAEEERERLAGEVRAYAERVSDLYNNAPVGYHSLGPDGTFLEINGTELAWLGYERDEVVGVKRFSDVTTPAGLELFSQEFPHLMQHGSIRDIEVDLVRRDATVFPVLINSTTVTDEDGTFVRTRSTIVDMTERKRAEKLVHEAREEAERANRAKDEFLSRMSHEIRTPLNAVLGFAQLLETDDLSRDQLDSVRQIRKAGGHLLELINEVLDISRIASGNLSVSTEPVAVAPVVDDIVALAQPLTTDRGVALRRGSADDVWVLANRQRLSQVLLNLVVNAIKYNRRSGDVELSWTQTGTGRVRISVVDTGMGFPADALGRLFQPFDRLGAEEGGVEGTGLGLALSKGLVEAMKGSIEVESEPGRGSRFTVDLPLAQPLAEPMVAAPGPRADGFRLETARSVLYVEDNASNLRLVERILEQRPGIRLLTAMQGRVGLDLAREHRPDLILLDVHLPDTSGKAFIEALRADPVTAAIPVVMISADATASQRTSFLAAGVHDYLTKPFDVARFLEVVDGALAMDPAPEEMP